MLKLNPITQKFDLVNSGAMVYPGAGIALSTGSAWGTSITNNSGNWNTAYGWGNHASAGYLTSLSGAVLVSQSTPQTIGVTGERLAKLWVTDITCSNAISGSITGNAGTVTNATLTTAFTNNGGAGVLTWPAAGTTLTVPTGGGTLGSAAFTASTAYDVSGSASTVQGNLNTHAALTGSSAHGLGTISTQAANSVSISGGTISGITDLAVADGGTGTGNGSITGTTALTFAAGGSNQNVILTPSGSGYTILNGNVGIGTADPGSYKLSVSGITRLGASSDYGATTVLNVAPGTVAFDAPGVSGGWFKIDGSTGKVGIGTASPTDKLNVVVTSNGNVMRLDGPTSGLIVQANASTADIISYGGTPTVYRDLNFATAATPAMTILTSGNVGIGTTSPAAKLAVNGGVNVGADTDPGDNNLYVVGDCSALTFTDRTPFYSGDAISEILNIRELNGEIDHGSLPEFVKVKRKLIKQQLNITENKEEIAEYTEERSLGAMVSMFTVAIQQLTTRIMVLEDNAVTKKNDRD